MKKVIQEMNLKKESLKRLRDKEEKKLLAARESEQIGEAEKNTSDIGGADYSKLFNDAGNAIDSIERLDLLEKLEQFGDLTLLEKILPLPAKTLESVLRSILEEFAKSNLIYGYQIYINTGRDKTGSPQNKNYKDNIYLYQSNHYERYNENHSLLGQLEAIQNCVPLVNLYFIPVDTNKVEEIGKKILDKTAKVLGYNYATRRKELFGV